MDTYRYTTSHTHTKKNITKKVMLLARNKEIQISLGRLHLHPRRSCCSDRFEVTDDKSYQVRAHLHTCIKPVLQELIVNLNCLDLKYANDSLQPFLTHIRTCVLTSMYAALTTGMLDREMYSGLLRIRMEKLALKLGSSKQGNAIRALVGSK